MSEESPKRPARRPRSKTEKDWLLTVPPALEGKVDEVAKKLPVLSKNDVARLAIERGLSVLLAQMTAPVPAHS